MNILICYLLPSLPLISSLRSPPLARDEFDVIINLIQGRLSLHIDLLVMALQTVFLVCDAKITSVFIFSNILKDKRLMSR